MSEPVSSHIIITSSIEDEVDELKKRFSHSRVVSFYKDDFLIDDVKEVVKEAYIAESETKYIILAAKMFNEASQNALLKILEEPPANIELIIVAESKASLLPTVRSRLPLVFRKKIKEKKTVELSLKKLDLAAMFAFIKEHDRIQKHEAKELIEALYEKALSEGIVLNSSQLESFEMAYKLIGLNARFSTVLSMLLMKFI